MKNHSDGNANHTHKFKGTHSSRGILSFDSGPMNQLFDNQKELHTYVTARALAKALGLSIHTIRKWRKQQKIKAHKFGRSVRYRVEEVLAEIE